jgi:hypothetical protein
MGNRVTEVDLMNKEELRDLEDSEKKSTKRKETVRLSCF